MAVKRWAVALFVVAGLVGGAAAWRARNAEPAIPEVVAEMDGRKVSREELERRARVFLSVALSDPKAPEAHRRLREMQDLQLGYLVRLVLLEEYARAEGQGPPEADVEARWRRLVHRVGREKLRASLEGWGVSEADLRRELWREALWEHYVRRYADQALRDLITEEVVRAHYESNRATFVIPARVKLRGILVKTREQAQQVRDQLLKGADMAALARKVSVDRTAAKGGDIGWMREDRLNPWLQEGIRGLRPGQVSQVIQGPPGFYVVRVEGRVPGRPMSYAEARALLRARLSRQEGEQALRVLLLRLKEERKLRFHYVPRR